MLFKGPGIVSARQDFQHVLELTSQSRAFWCLKGVKLPMYS